MKLAEGNGERSVWFIQQWDEVMELGLKDKVVWVVGGTGMLGKASAQTLAEAGARIAISSRRDKAVASVVEEFKGQDHDALAVPFDASDPAAAKNAAERIVSEWGGIDTLVATTAVPAFGEFLDLDKASFETAFENKFHVYIACIQAVLPQMLAKGGGNVVFVTGVGGKMPIGVHMPGGSVCAALNLIVRGLANQYASKNVRINAVSPGLIMSPRLDAMHEADQSDDSRTKSIPMGRFGQPNEIADAVTFLASDCSSYITGTVLQVDGGATMAL